MKFNRALPTENVTKDALERIEKTNRFEQTNPTSIRLSTGYCVYRKGKKPKEIFEYYETAVTACGGEGVVTTTAWLLDKGIVDRKNVPDFILDRYDFKKKQLLDSNANKYMFKYGMLLQDATTTI